MNDIDKEVIELKLNSDGVYVSDNIISNKKVTDKKYSSCKHTVAIKHNPLTVVRSIKQLSLYDEFISGIKKGFNFIDDIEHIINGKY